MNEILMQSVLNTLARGPMTMAGIIIVVTQEASEVDSAVEALISQGKVERFKRGGWWHFARTDRYNNNPSPDPEAA